eukprot:TRINITY_DN1064_c0_g1_i1.p1 TRINITY_DN1064_c0_g1~~TRINITY_DN1064_c0_g1_i1.p1  ORF type:complete len:226 (-),score=51.79 TRINITY_DN1064_c0_g1_i1:21-698(-)
MPRTTSKSSTSTTTKESASAKPSSSSSSSKSQSSKVKEQDITNLYEKYKEQENDQIGPDGIESLCTDLDISALSLTALILAWKLKAKTMGYFKREEFVSGLTSLNCHDITTLKKALATAERETKTSEEDLSQLYEYAFNFCCEDEKKYIDTEIAAGMLELVIGDLPHVSSIISFLQSKPIAVINRDQWKCFREFSKSVKPDLSNYDEDSSWPILIDDYVEYVQSK